MKIPEYVILTDEKMKLHVEEGHKLMEEERIRIGMELYTGEVEAMYTSDAGAELQELDTYNEEFTGLIEDMFEKLPMEKKILEGAELPVYNPKTDFTDTKTEHQQWNSVLPSGCLTTGPTRTSLTGLSNSVSTVEHWNQISHTLRSEGKSIRLFGNSCSEKLDGCGSAIDATNESSECTVPMISEQMDGMPSEVKWSQPLKCTESLEATLPAEMS
jgi:hypothetical protein